MPSRKGPITSPLDPNLSGLVFRPQQQILANRGAGGGSRNINEWADLAEGLDQLGSGAGNTLLRMLRDKQAAEGTLAAQRLKEDEAKGRALAIQHGIKLRKEGVNALKKAENLGLFNGVRPDVVNSFAMNYGRNFALSESFNQNILDGLDNQINDAVENHHPLDVFQENIRKHFTEKIEKDLENLPNNEHTRLGFLNAAEQKIQQMMAKAQNSYATAVEAKNVSSIKAGLHRMFQLAFTQTGEIDPLTGATTIHTTLDESFRNASLFFSEGIGGEYSLPLPPKDSLPVEINRREFYWDTFKSVVTTQVFPEGHPKRVESLEFAIDSTLAFARHKMAGANTFLFAEGEQAPKINEFVHKLRTDLVKAKLAQDANMKEHMTDARSWLTSVIRDVGDRWTENEVRLPNGELFDISKNTHQDFLLKKLKEDRVNFDGPVVLSDGQVETGDIPEGTFGFSFEEGNPYSPPNKIIADLLNEGFVSREFNNGIREALVDITKRNTIDSFNQKAVKDKADDKRKTFIEASIKIRAAAHRKAHGKGAAWTTEELKEWAQELEAELDREDFLKGFLANVEGASSDGMYDFTLDSVFQELNSQLKNRGETVIGSDDEIIADLMEGVGELDLTDPHALRTMRQKILRNERIPISKKTALLQDITDMGKALGSLTDSSDLANKHNYDSLIKSLMTKSKLVAQLAHAINFAGDAAGKEDFKAAQSALDSRLEPKIRTLIVNRARGLIKNGVSIQDAIDTGLWENIYRSKDIVKYKDKDGKEVEVKGITQEVLGDVTKRIPWDDIPYSQQWKAEFERLYGKAFIDEIKARGGISEVELLFQHLHKKAVGGGQ